MHLPSLPNLTDTALCRPDFGFGVSGGMNGGYVNMGNSVVWDMMVVSPQFSLFFGVAVLSPLL